jgi:formate dehydrogenase subunit gamma
MTKSGEPRNLERERTRRVLARCEPSAELGSLAAAVQQALGYVPPLAIPLLAERAGLAEDEVLRRLEQDEDLRLEPAGRHRVSICTGRTCARRGGAALARSARRALGIDLFRTTSDRAIHLEPFLCFGQCAMAPNVRIDGGLQGAMTERRLLLLLEVLGRR